LQLPWTFLGLPAISLPVGVDETGMPLAVQLIGALGADERLLAVARWCEQALDIDLHPTLALPKPNGRYSARSSDPAQALSRSRGCGSTLVARRRESRPAWAPSSSRARGCRW
jgi:hypothetical protein